MKKVLAIAVALLLPAVAQAETYYGYNFCTAHDISKRYTGCVEFEGVPPVGYWFGSKPFTTLADCQAYHQEQKLLLGTRYAGGVCY